MRPDRCGSEGCTLRRIHADGPGGAECRSFSLCAGGLPPSAQGLARPPEADPVGPVGAWSTSLIAVGPKFRVFGNREYLPLWDPLVVRVLAFLRRDASTVAAARGVTGVVRVWRVDRADVVVQVVGCRCAREVCRTMSRAIRHHLEPLVMSESGRRPRAVDLIWAPRSGIGARHAPADVIEVVTEGSRVSGP